MNEEKPKRRQPPIGPWMGIGGMLGMAVGALAAWGVGQPYDQAMGTGACLGVTAGALLAWGRAWTDRS